MADPPAQHGGGALFALAKIRPRLAHAVFVAPGSVVIGDVEIGEGSSVWFNCTLREYGFFAQDVDICICKTEAVGIATNSMIIIVYQVGL